MKIRPRLGWVIFSSIAIQCACDPAFRFTGSVKDEFGNPVPNALARVQCGTIFATAETDSAGRFSVNATGWCPSTCTVEVSAKGRSDWKRPVMDLCKSRPWHLRDACLEVVAEATLTRPSRMHATPPM